jgi:hypothetical protein
MDFIRNTILLYFNYLLSHQIVIIIITITQLVMAVLWLLFRNKKTSMYTFMIRIIGSIIGLLHFLILLFYFLFWGKGGGLGIVIYGIICIPIIIFAIAFCIPRSKLHN